MPSVSPLRLLPGLLLVVLLALPATADAARRVERGGPPPAGSGPITLKTFLRAVDGETLEVFIKGRQVGVRVAGVSTPQPNTTCGRAATDALQGLVAGGGRLHDVRGVVFDRRKLRVYRVTDLKGTGVASKLALAGVVRAVRGKGASRAVIAAERRARAARRGCLWNSAARRRAAAERRAAEKAATRRAASRLRRGRVTARAAADNLPAGFTDQVMGSGLTMPTAFAFTPDGRAFIAEKNGLVRVWKGGQVLATPLVDIRARVNDYWDRGLIGITVHPQFATNGYVYLLYAYENNRADYQGRKISRLTRLQVSGDTAAASSETTILDNIPSEWYGHSVGNVKFASDGNIFLTAGDASTWNQVTDDALRAQSIDSLAGKVIRISPTGAGLADNPYWDGNPASVRSKVWARGLRNGFRFNLQPTTNTPYIGDVGWSTWEEIDVATKGANFGWPCYEGPARQAGYEPKATCQSLYAQGTAAVTAPLQYWANAGGAAATGGAFYSGTTWPTQYRGLFFYGDYVKGWLRATSTSGGTPLNFATNAGGPVAMEAGPDSNLWYLAINTGELRQLRYGAAPPPPPLPDGESFLSDATPLSSVNGYGPVEKDRSNGEAAAGDGRALTLAGVTYPKGLGTHAESTIRYSLGGRCSRLTARIGVDDEVASNGSVTFEVWGDTTRLYASPTMTGASATAAIDVPLTGRGELRLVVTGAGNGISYDHADWADARVTCGTTTGSAPVPTISAPDTSLRFKVGDTISFAGGATDAEDGTIPETGLSWQITLQHCSSGTCHAHPLQAVAGSSGSFVVPDHGDQIEFTLALTATDSSGRKTTVSHTVLPQLVQMTLATSPTGLEVVNGGERAIAPMTRTVVAGSQHTILAPSPQGDRTFSSWSDGGAAQHDVTIGTTDATWTATFSGTADTTPPTVTGIEPAAGATGVAVGANVTATFSEAMQATSITDQTVRLTPQGSTTAVAAAVTYDATTRRATLDPASALAAGTAYTATVRSGTSGVKDSAGNAMAADRTWTFTTAAGGSDTNPPSSIGRAVVDGDILSPHAVVTTADGTIYAAEFGVYVASAGEPARRYVWKYTPNGAGGYTKTRVVGTADGAACGEGQSGSLCGDGGPATSARLGRLSGLAVDAAGRVYIAESFWQRVRVISASGIIRTVDGSGGLNVPEGLAYDATTNTVLVTDKRNNRLRSFPATDGGAVTWTTVAGTGTQCSSPTAACGDGGAATSAQLRLPGAVAVDRSGVIYLADSGAYRIRKVIRGGAITAFAGNGTICASTATCGDGGPATAASFGDPTTSGSDGEGPFGVATTPNGVVYIADSDINRVRRVLTSGIIETIATLRHPKAPYALATATGHDMVVPEWNGNTVVRLTGVDNTIVGPPPADTTPPTVTAIDPASGATSVPVGTSVTATFSESMQAASVTTATVTLTAAGATTPVAAAVSYDATARRATLVPSAALAAGTQYTARVRGGTSGVKDAAGNALATDRTWTFTTASGTGGGSTTTFLSDRAWIGTPVNGYGPVERDTSNGENLAGDGRPLTLAGIVYAKGLGTHAVSEIRYALGGSCSRLTAAVGVDDSRGTLGSVVFQVWGDTVKLFDSARMTGASPTQLVDVSLSGRSELRLVVTDAGDGIAHDHGDWADAKITCGGTEPADTTAPTVATVDPAAGATDVAVGANVTATFSEAMQAGSISGTSVTLTPAGSTTAVGAAVTYDGATRRAILDPASALAASTQYTATVRGGTAGVKDVAGNALAADRTWTFTTAASAPTDTTPPTVTAVDPASGATSVSVDADVVATFSEAMQASSISGSTVTLTAAGSTTPVAGTVSYDATTRRATLNPTSALAASTQYTATVRGGTAGVKDVAGNALAADRTWTFTTAAPTAGTTTHLSDRTWTSMTNGWGPVEKDRANGGQAAGDGPALILAGVTYAKGLGAHAASDIRYAINGACSRLTGLVGVDDSRGSLGSVVFQVWGDSTLLYDSGTMTGSSATKSFDVSLTGRTTLRLVVTAAGNGVDHDHADWANPRITCG